MKGLIDTHDHVYLEDFDPDQDRLIAEARASGIDTLLFPNVDLTTIERMNNLTDRYPDFAFPMMGFHPTSVDSNYVNNLHEIESYLAKRPYCGIGEIGIDLYWDRTFIKEQKEVFEEQLRWSIDLNLPVAIHTRSAYQEVFDSIAKIGASRLKGVFHSFTGTADELKEINKLENFLIGINGVITFKNSALSHVLAQETTIDKVVLETDCPYLAPVPYRGRRNEPAFIWKTAEKVALTFGLTLEQAVEATRTNALTLFKTLQKT